MYEIRSSVSFDKTASLSFFQLKNVDRAVTPRRVICSSVPSPHSSAMRKKARKAGPESPFRSSLGFGTVMFCMADHPQFGYVSPIMHYYCIKVHIEIQC